MGFLARLAFLTAWEGRPTKEIDGFLFRFPPPALLF